MIATHTATVEIRIPRDGDANLVDAAGRRLKTVVDGVEVLGLRGVEPALSATVVTIEVRVNDDPGQLVKAPGVEGVELKKS